MESQNGHTARTRHLQSDWPQSKADAPAAKALFEAAKREQTQDDQASDWTRRKAALDKMAAELRFILRLQHGTQDEHRKRIEHCLQRMGETLQ